MSRRIFLQGISATGVTALAGSALASPQPLESDVPEVDSMPDELHVLTPVPLENVVIDDEFWSPKREIWRSVTFWDCFQKFEEHMGGALNNFDKVRDGTGKHGGLPWYDGLIYEMIRAAADFLRNQPDARMEAKVDGYIARIVAAAAKDPGGYVNTYTQLNEPDHRWGLNGGLEVWQHEFYNLGALVDAGVHYYRATGKTPLLEAGIRIADTMSELVGPPPKKNLVPAHELPEEAMLGLYELLKERPELHADPAKYLALAEFWIENRGRNSGLPNWEPDRGKAEEQVRKFDDYSHGRPTWGAYAQDDKPVFEQDQVVGHAVRATLLCSAVAATARVNHRDEYKQAATRLWESMTWRRMHITGGVGAYSEEEKFGPDYVLPNDAYLETCAAVGAGFFHQNMNRTFGHAGFVDELERVLYNGALCGVSLKGDRYTYENPILTNRPRERWEWHDCPCCPPMFLKLMGAMPSYIYATDADSVYVNLFVGGHARLAVNGRDLVLRQTTKYPWDGAVRLDVQPEQPAEFGLMVRIPAWCRGAKVKVNGQTVPTGKRVRGYVRIQREWQEGDTVEISLPMPVETVSANPKVTANLGRVALMRGPVVYCVEGQGAGAIQLSAKPDLKPEHLPDHLGGVVVIHASSVDPESSVWKDRLYGAAPATGEKKIVAIPFYANGNQTPAPLAVWLVKGT